MRAVHATSRRRASRSGFVGVLLASLGVHGLAFAAVVYAQSRKPRLRPPTGAIPVELVRLGKPRDARLLPRKRALAPAPSPDAVALRTPEKPPPKARPKRRPKSTDERMSAAARRLLAEAPDARLDDALTKIEAQEGSPDGSAYGTTTDPNRAARGYEAQVGTLLKQRYRIPELIPASQRRFLVAEVVLFIQPSGVISRYEFTKRHPNQLFMQALERLLKTTKLPPPPRAVRRRYRDEGMVVRFVP